MTRERWHCCFRVAVACGFALAWAGVLCRGRDSWLVPAVIYYSTPWLLRLLAGILTLVTFKHWGVRAMAVTCAVVSLMEGWHSFRLDPLPAMGPDAPRVAVWNAARALYQRKKEWSEMAGIDMTDDCRDWPLQR